jgi:hypothetical protein
VAAPGRLSAAWSAQAGADCTSPAMATTAVTAAIGIRLLRKLMGLQPIGLARV